MRRRCSRLRKGLVVAKLRRRDGGPNRAAGTTMRSRARFDAVSTLRPSLHAHTHTHTRRWASNGAPRFTTCFAHPARYAGPLKSRSCQLAQAKKHEMLAPIDAQVFRKGAPFLCTYCQHPVENQIVGLGALHSSRCAPSPSPATARSLISVENKFATESKSGTCVG